MTGFAMSAQPGGDVRVVLSFENDDQAQTNADSRSALAEGPAPGQGGDFADRFLVDSVTADGSVVTLALTPKEGQFVLSDLSTRAGAVRYLLSGQRRGSVRTRRARGRRRGSGRSRRRTGARPTRSRR